MGAGHSHGAHRSHGPEVTVERWPRLVLLTCLAVAGVVTLVGVFMLWPDGSKVDRITSQISFAAPGVTFPTATITHVGTACVDPGQQGGDCNTMKVAIDQGPDKDTLVTVQVPPQVINAGLQSGDQVKLQRTPAQEGGEVQYGYFGTVRNTPLTVLLLVFVVLVVAVARWRGALALVGLAFSGIVIWKFMLPALLSGQPGLAVGLCSAALIMFVVLYTTHGFSLRTSAALAGTLVGVLLTAVLSVTAAGAARATGVSDESASVLQSLVGGISFHGLFACAAVIVGLGVLNDVTITQSSSVWEIRAASPEMGRARVFASSMRIGRDHIASTIYTIVFAYAGTALAILLVLQLYGLPFGDLLTTEDITEEIIRTLASSIGLVLAVPLTTGIATLVMPRGAVEPSPGRA
jgi:uncharacterized membrane protein